MRCLPAWKCFFRYMILILKYEYRADHSDTHKNIAWEITWKSGDMKIKIMYVISVRLSNFPSFVHHIFRVHSVVYFFSICGVRFMDLKSSIIWLAHSCVADGADPPTIPVQPVCTIFVIEGTVENHNEKSVCSHPFGS